MTTHQKIWDENSPEVKLGLASEEQFVEFSEQNSYHASLGKKAFRCLWRSFNEPSTKYPEHLNKVAVIDLDKITGWTSEYVHGLEYLRVIPNLGSKTLTLISEFIDDRERFLISINRQIDANSVE